MIKQVMKNIAFGVKISYESSHFYFFLKCSIVIANTVFPLIMLIIWRKIINQLNGTFDLRWIMSLLAAYLSFQLMTSLLSKINNYVVDRYYDERTFYIENILLRSVSRIDLKYMESSVFSDKLQNIRNSFGALHDTAWIAFDMMGGLVNMIIAFVILSRYRVWLGISMILFLAPFFLYNQFYNQKMFRIRKKQANSIRMKEYCNSVCMDNQNLFEMKLYRCQPFFATRSNEIFQRLFTETKKEQKKHLVVDIFLLLIGYLCELMTFIVVIGDILASKVGVGDLQYYLGVANSLYVKTISMINQVNTFTVNNTQITDFKEFMDTIPRYMMNGEKELTGNPKIEFCDVSFKYPGSNQYILKNCSFVIEPDERIALLGLNGSGKTTIIKLLLRFYDIDGGCIKINGIDIREYDVYSLRNAYGILFQDFVKYCLPLREIIALSDFEGRFDDKRLMKACERSGAAKIIKDWEKGFDTVIGRYYADDGKDFSGGQWQVISLARAYFRERGFMILDEPSAALDPITEDKIFTRLYSISEGKSSIIISHHLSNTVLCDRILFLQEGRVSEQGSHRELLQRDGEYARLYKLQAGKY